MLKSLEDSDNWTLDRTMGQDKLKLALHFAAGLSDKQIQLVKRLRATPILEKGSHKLPIAWKDRVHLRRTKVKKTFKQCTSWAHFRMGKKVYGGGMERIKGRLPIWSGLLLGPLLKARKKRVGDRRKRKWEQPWVANKLKKKMR